MTDWEMKFKTLFDNAVVDKGLMQKFESFKLPRFVSEYIVQMFIDEHGFEVGVIKIEEFLNKHYPKATTNYGELFLAFEKFPWLKGSSLEQILNLKEASKQHFY